MNNWIPDQLEDNVNGGVLLIALWVAIYVVAVIANYFIDRREGRR